MRVILLNKREKFDTCSIENQLLEKSTEAFYLAIELYNKPTLKYRVEGFSHFICNAWELMLKSHMIKTLGENSIYYKNNPQRTLSLENCIQKIFTNNKDPLRIKKQSTRGEYRSRIKKP